jgi:RNase adaptor protein for sRNA GlmZ degradation
VSILSFSYRVPTPTELYRGESALSEAHNEHGGGFIFDCRCLPNPGRDERYKILTGLDYDVAEYLRASDAVTIFQEHAFKLIEGAISNYLSRGFTDLKVGFGCTGGQHRSVFLAEGLKIFLIERFNTSVAIDLHHCNKERWRR